MINENEADVLHVMNEELAARQGNSNTSLRDRCGYPALTPGGAVAAIGYSHLQDDEKEARISL